MVAEFFAFNQLQVDAFLEAHDSGLTDADKEVAKGLLHTYSNSDRTLIIV